MFKVLITLDNIREVKVSVLMYTVQLNLFWLYHVIISSLKYYFIATDGPKGELWLLLVCELVLQLQYRQLFSVKSIYMCMFQTSRNSM